MEYDELTPTWAATADMLISILENDMEEKNQAYAKSEIRRMGQIIDHLEKRTASE